MISWYRFKYMAIFCGSTWNCGRSHKIFAITFAPVAFGDRCGTLEGSFKPSKLSAS